MQTKTLSTLKPLFVPVSFSTALQSLFLAIFLPSVSLSNAINLPPFFPTILGPHSSSHCHSSAHSKGRTRRPHESVCYISYNMAHNYTPLWLITLFMFLHVSNLVSSGASESEALLKFKASLQNHNTLTSWNLSTTPCSADHANWVGLHCRKGKVRGLRLENMGLRGVIDVDLLVVLSNLRAISFMDNNFEGPLPNLKKLSALKSVYLSNNEFSGQIPADAFLGMVWLKKVHLARNHFVGKIPTSLTSLPKLLELRLEDNAFIGRIPDFQQTSLNSFNVSHNDLEGRIPASLSRIDSSSFSGNEELCGNPLGKCKKASVLSIVVIFIVVGVAIAATGAVILILYRRRHQSSSVEAPPSSILGRKSGIKESDHAGQGSPESSGTNKRTEVVKLSFVRDDRQRFDMQDLLKASAEILGSGSFGSSYKADLQSGPVMVVKRFKHMNNMGKQEFQEHMRMLGMLRHPNLLPLVAYYYRKEEKLLAFDYVDKGSLAVQLHGHQALGLPALDWSTRLKIVKGVARGLQYLYNELPNLIAPHGHLKSSNVLLNESFKPLLTDYGLVPVMNQEHSQEVMVIYKSPEYLQHGRITKKTDVWSFGVLILEILTGTSPSNILQQGKGNEEEISNLSWVNSVVPDNVVFDKEIGATENSKGEMHKLLRIGLACCEGNVDKRWDLKEAVERIEELRENNSSDQDFFTSYASTEADIESSRGLSGDFNSLI